MSELVTLSGEKDFEPCAKGLLVGSPKCPYNPQPQAPKTSTPSESLNVLLLLM